MGVGSGCQARSLRVVKNVKEACCSPPCSRLAVYCLPFFSIQQCKVGNLVQRCLFAHARATIINSTSTYQQIFGVHHTMAVVVVAVVVTVEVVVVVVVAVAFTRCVPLSYCSCASDDD